ncbi:GIY-YIG catalytic domain protein [Clostridium formicaceticum]|uniref:GIY-YIG catalytic domain protein n=1 Tax=Clostridium formicaceticum TaxID=1497 RepID=A0AAC9RKZ5_9CLOT|nr:GIY-YIG catalytic domain protein [Clostridium formicaceticum]
MERIILNWYGPYSIDNIKNYDVAYLWGIYAIYRRWGNREKLLYIGKTEREFLERINEHYGSWLWGLRGQLAIRLATLQYSKWAYAIFCKIIGDFTITIFQICH